ncbi:MAG: hypothetical protein HY556_01235 [Euryarchaeota archaeon]|nr:hypothetical protein [Euryarchaeota archaeon]
MAFHSSRNRSVLVTVLLLAAAVAVATDIEAFSGGLDRRIDPDLVVGCTCHNKLPSSAVKIGLEGIPANYTIGDKYTQKTYPINISILSGGPDVAPGKAQGGFNLNVSAGRLQVPKDAKDVQIMEITNDATQTPAGNKQRSWMVEWVAPAAPSGPVEFILTVNAVNGNGVQDEEGKTPEVGTAQQDAWNRVILISEGSGAAAAGGHAGGGIPVNEIGVTWHAHWVGVASFLALFVLYVFTFFILRYGESKHATDHRDRSEGASKGAGSVVTDAKTNKLLMWMAIIAAILIALEIAFASKLI